MNTIDKGYLGEMKVAAWAAERGYLLSKPLAEARYDFVLDDGKRLWRAQVKYVDHVRKDTGAIQVDLRSECRNSGYRKRYAASEVDVVLAFLAPVDTVCWLEPGDFEGRTTLNLRTSAARNGQVKHVRFVEDFAV